MSSQRASAREAIATVGHALAGQSQPVMFVGGTVTALYPLEGGMRRRRLPGQPRPRRHPHRCLRATALCEQIAAEGTVVATFVRTELVGLAAKEAFIDAVPAHFEGDRIGQARADVVLAWLSLRPGSRPRHV